MTTPQPKSRKNQFGLRKLLLWTAVVALYSGMFRMLAPILDGWVFLLSGIIILAIIRMATNAITTAVISVMAAGVLLFVGLFGEMGLYAVMPINLLMAFGGACYWGVLLFAVVELPLRAVNWLDDLMETKSDGETRRD